MFIELLYLNGYGQFVWPAFFFTFISLFYLYASTKKELNKVKGAVKKEGFSIIPINLFFNEKGLAKLTFGLGKGKKKFDKRASIKAREWNLSKQRLEKNKNYN